MSNEVQVKKLTDIMAQFVGFTAKKLPDDVIAKLQELRDQEDSPMAKVIYDTMFRNQELALAAAPALAGQNAAVFSVGSDGTDGPTDAAGGYADGDTAAALAAAGWNLFDTLQNNDAYHALQAVEGLIITGATGTNVNDVAVVLIGGEEQADA